MVELICKILKIGKASYYRYKKSNEPILNLIKYFSKEELIELQNTSKIYRLELIKDFSIEQIELALKYYLIEEIQKENKQTSKLENEIEQLNQTIQNMNADIKKISKKVLDEDSFSIYEFKEEQKIAQEELQKLIREELSNNKSI